MGSLTNFSELELLDHVLNAAYTPAATLYLALCTSDPGEAATGASCNEVAEANGYSVRPALAFGAAATRKITQNALCTFPTASGAWGTVTHWCVVTSATYGAGDALAYGEFSVEKVIVSGNTPSIASGQVYVEFSAGEISDYLAVALLDLMFRNQAYSKPATYVAMCTVEIADADTGITITEPAGGSYVRKQVNINGGAAPTWDLAAAGIVDNTDEITLATATGAWGEIVAVAVVDDPDTGEGHLLLYDNAIANQTVGIGDTCLFDAGTFDNVMS